MALLNLSYGSLAFLRVVNVLYDDTAKAIISGSVSDTVIPSGLGADVEIWRTDGVGEHWSVRTQNTSPFAYVQHVVDPVVLPCDITIVSVDRVEAMNGNGGSFTIHATGSGTLKYSISGFPPQVSNVFNDLDPGSYVLTVLRDEDSCNAITNGVIHLIPDLQVTTSSQNSTSNGSNDGQITVTIVQGSGDYSIDFVTEGVVVPTDGVNPVTRLNLSPDTYIIIVTDNVTGQTRPFQITLTEPAVVIHYNGTILDFSPLNSIQVVVDDSNVEQGLDNRLLCNQIYGDYDTEQYYQKYNVGDKPKIQFKSNYEGHNVELRKQSNDAFVKNFGAIKVEDNITKLRTFTVTLFDGSAGQTNIFFSTAELPVPFSVGDSVAILEDNPDFDGTYVVVFVGFDTMANSQYIAINKNFGSPASNLANISIKDTAADFDVYESTIDFTSVLPGQYYLKITAATSSGNIKYAFSEPIEIAVRHENLLLIVYNNYDNAFNIEWLTGYTGFIRVEGLFGHKRPTGGERTTSREADFSLVKISARKTRNILVELFILPPYLAEKLSVVFDCDVFSINNVPCQSSEGLQISNVDRSILVDATILVEQLNWFNKYNSTDDLMSSVSETSDCACDEIDLVPVSSSPSTIVLNFAGKRQRIFRLQPSFSTSKTISLANISLGLAFRLKFTVAQTFVDNGCYIEFPSAFQSNAVPLWDNTTKRFSPLDAGTYDVEATTDGTNWQIVFQPYVFS